MFSALLWFSLASTVLGQSPATRPAQIILIRHAEEPHDKHNPHLSNRGVERADRLVSFISTDTLMTRFGLPVAVFATRTTKDGFGLNKDLNHNGRLSDYELKYYGEPKIETLTPAPNAVVLLFHLCYASGNSEPDRKAPSLSTAKQRVDNYASAFLRAGAGAVIANGHSQDPYYIAALFTTIQTIDAYWRGAPDFHNQAAAFASSRSPGTTYQLDPEAAGRYYRSVAGDLELTTTEVTGAPFAPPPPPEPTPAP